MPFPEEEYSDQSFEAADEKGGILEEIVFEGCRFERCNFGGATFKRCRFVDCTFDHCDLSNVLLNGSTFRDVKFLGCKAVGITWPNAASLSHVSFESCVVSLASFSGLELKKLVLKECIARETDFTDCDLTEANLRGTDLAGARFSRTNLQKADLRSAKSYTIRADANKLKRARFSLPEATLLLYGLDIELEE